jgi:hypothetical protein
MITSIIIGALSGIASFTLCLLAVARFKSKDNPREWLEPYWKASVKNSEDQAAYLERIAHVLEMGK